jgi:hypothetical protein
MNLSFVNSTNINNQNIFYKELKVNHLKIIYKTLLGDEPDAELVFVNFNNILKDLTSYSEDELNQLDFITYFILLLEIRCTSIGNTIITDLPDKVNTSVEINIHKFIDILKEIITTNNVFFKEEFKDIAITYRYPCIKDILKINNSTTFDSFYPGLVDTIQVKDTIIDFKKINKSDYTTILNQLPAKITSVIIKKAYSIVEQFNKVNLLQNTFGLEDKHLYFNFNIKNLISILKLVFGNQLLSLYDNILALAKVGNMSPEYIENCTPGEYILFTKRLEQLNSQQNKQSQETPIQSDIADDLNPYESPDLPPITSRSEFTP